MFFKSVQIGLYTIIPVLGMLFFNWDWRQVIVLYWFENISLGIIALTNLIRSNFNIADSKNLTAEQRRMHKILSRQPAAIKAFTAVFFSLHYGAFTLGHGLFVFALANGEIDNLPASVNAAPTLDIGALIPFWLLGLIVQLTLSLTKPVAQMTPDSKFYFPYGRITTLHVSILLGTFLITYLNLPSTAAIMLVIIHGISDFLAIRRQNKLATRPTSSTK